MCSLLHNFFVVAPASSCLLDGVHAMPWLLWQVRRAPLQFLKKVWDISVTYPSTTSTYQIQLIFPHNKIRSRQPFFIFRHLPQSDHGVCKLATIRLYHHCQSWPRHPRIGCKVPRNMYCEFSRWGFECKSATALKCRTICQTFWFQAADFLSRASQVRVSSLHCVFRLSSPPCSLYLYQLISAPSITTQVDPGDTWSLSYGVSEISSIESTSSLVPSYSSDRSSCTTLVRHNSRLPISRDWLGHRCS